MAKLSKHAVTPAPRPAPWPLPQALHHTKYCQVILLVVLIQSLCVWSIITCQNARVAIHYVYTVASSGGDICMVNLVIGHLDTDMDACHVPGLYLLSQLTIPCLSDASADVTSL